MTLSTPISADKAQANFENGVLTLVLPKAEEAKPKQIKVNGKTGSQPVDRRRNRPEAAGMRGSALPGWAGQGDREPQE